ncbi:hypothetical protein PMAC_002358 [Pneumocystis sp. 'macacae']|nr:hypothetical protein PMAC_002358 [Pneumocystis sp. 'macacae']
MSELQAILLLLNPVDSVTLCEVGLKLRPQDYENVLLERNLKKFCGYPLCHNPPRVKITKISYRKCKIYDQRKLLRFCSSNCFKKSAFFAAQLNPEPLWLRNTQTSSDIRLLDEQLEGSMSISDAKLFQDTSDPSLNIASSDLNTNNLLAKKHANLPIFNESVQSISYASSFSTSFPIVERLSSIMKFNVVERFPDAKDYEHIEGFAARIDKWKK